MSATDGSSLISAWVLICLARFAKNKHDRVCMTSAAAGEIVHSTMVLELLSMHSLRSCVSTLSRNGTCNGRRRSEAEADPSCCQCQHRWARGIITSHHIK